MATCPLSKAEQLQTTVTNSSVILQVNCIPGLFTDQVYSDQVAVYGILDDVHRTSNLK